MGGGREDWLVAFSDSDDDEAAPPPALSGGDQKQSVFFAESSSSDNDEALSALPEKSPDLSEFVGSGGGEGIFRVPLRAAVHPGRPPALELRPHPLRETQAGIFLRTIACSDSQLWAGQESGVRFWSLADKFGRGAGTGAGDADAAPFCESWQTSPALCLVVDGGNRLVWSGHKDGRIRSWKMDQRLGDGDFREGFTWMAHRGPVLSMVFTAYGDLWSGSEGGVIKVWPWESIEKSLSLPAEERHMAALMVERGHVDLRAQVTVNGVCSLPGDNVKILLSDHSRAKVWSASYLSFALWDARTRDLLKVFGIDGQIEKYGELVPSFGDSYEEDKFKSKFATVTKKEKIQGTMNFFQRSRNALMGAADAVRRAAVKRAFGDDNRRVEAMVVTMDGAIWSGSANGTLAQWDGKGNRVQEIQYQQCAVQCFCSFGTRLWVGYVSGMVQVLELDGSPIGSWIAHKSPVMEMEFGGGYVFTLANHGGIRGWNMSSPGPIDNVLRSALASKEPLYTKIENVKILAGTWNVGQERASPDSLISWLGSAATGADIVVAGLQEVEMGAGFLAMAAAKETVGLEGSGNGQWWLQAIGKTLDEGTSFERVGSRQLAGLLIAVWARSHLRSHIGDVDVAAVPCGFGRALGNKGAVGLRLRVYNRILCFVNCHFAAHLEAINRRNSDFDYVYRTMVFSHASNVFSAPAASGSSFSVQCQHGSANAVGVRSEDERPELAEADMIIFLGDFNYRLFGISYDEARDFISQRCFDWLREKDQLREEMKAGKVFQGMREGVIRFPPTYKFERNQAGLAGYDSSEKKRIPAWCDRILYRDSRKMEDASCSLHCPVISSISQYDACMDVTDSDHKPVRCIFDVAIARVDESVRREQFGEITLYNKMVKLLLEKLGNIPETIVSTNTIILQNDNTSVLRVTNKCRKNKAFFKILCEGQTTIKDNGTASERNARGSYGFPRWLEVHPTTGIITPGDIAEVSVLHKDSHILEEFVDGIPQNWWCEDTRDKEITLLIRITGCFSSEVRTHRVSVRHCLSSKSTLRTDSSQNVKHAQTNLLHRSDFRPLISSSDLVDDFCGLHT